MTERQKLLLATYPDFVAKNLISMRTIRKNLGWRLNATAKNAGFTPQHYSLIELLRVLPKKDTYNKIARFFDWEIWE